MTQLDLGTPRRNWRNRPLAREPDARRNRSLWSLLLWMLVAVAPLACYLHQQNECLKLNYELADLRVERERMAETERRLRVERATLESLEQIERWAIEQRGLVRPAPAQVVVVSAPRRAGDEWLARAPGTADAAAR